MPETCRAGAVGVRDLAETGLGVRCVQLYAPIQILPFTRFHTTSATADVLHGGVHTLRLLHSAPGGPLVLVDRTTIPVGVPTTALIRALAAAVAHVPDCNSPPPFLPLLTFCSLPISALAH